MNQKPRGRTSSSEQIIRDIKRKTRKQYSAEENIRIVLDGLRGEDSIAELCRREGIAQSLYYKWSKDFMEAGKKRLAAVYSRGNPVPGELVFKISNSRRCRFSYLPMPELPY
jgi:transposase